MIHYEGKKLGVRPPVWKSRRDGGPTYDHRLVLDAVRKMVSEFHGSAGDERLFTTYDGMDAVGAVELTRVRGGRVPPDTRAWFGFANCNSNRQRSGLFAGVAGDGWTIVLDRYDLAYRTSIDKLKLKVEDGVARFSMSLDRYVERVRALREEKLTRIRTDRITLQLLRHGAVTWRRVRMLEELTPTSRESAFDYLSRFSVVASSTLPITSMPPINVLQKQWLAYREVVSGDDRR